MREVKYHWLKNPKKPRIFPMVVAELINMLLKTDRAGLAIMAAAMHRPITSEAVNATKQKKKKNPLGEIESEDESIGDDVKEDEGKIVNENISLNDGSSSSSSITGSSIMKDKDTDKSMWGKKITHADPILRDR